MLRDYTTYMRGVDVADQLKAPYSSHPRSHKWWHRMFWFLIDMTKVNMYIMYLSHAVEGRNPILHPMSHSQFKTALAKALLRNWEHRMDISNAELTHRPKIHMPSYTHLRRPCVVCASHICTITNIASNSYAGKKDATKCYKMFLGYE